MKIKSLIIKNFRSIKEAAIEIEDIIALVGENNVGKSAVLRSLNSFFNFNDERRAFESEEHRHGSKTQFTDITLIFTLPDIVQQDDYEKYMDNNNLVVRFRYSYKSNKKTFSFKQGTSYINISDDHDLLRKIDKSIHFVYIPVNRTMEDINFSTDSLFKKVIEESLRVKTEHRDRISPSLKKELTNVENKILKNVANNIDRYYLLNHSFDFKVQFKGNIDYSIILNDIELKISDSNREFHLKDCGSGIISMAIISMHLVLAEINHSNVVFGIEEPEINLHPQAQKELVVKMLENKQINQLFLTTHSPVIIDQLGHQKVVLVRREFDNKKNVQSILYQLSKDFFDDNDIKEYKYYQFFDYRNSDFFFSKIVIIAESKNDAQVIDYLLSSIYNIDPIKYGISIINLEGIKNFRYPYYLLEQLKIPKLLVVDKDFFTNYKNGKLENSRDSEGFPQYNGQLKLKKFMAKLTKRETLVKKFENLIKKNNHTDILDFLEEYNIVCMNYNLECDLIATTKGKEGYFNALNINMIHRTTSTLLNQYSDKIKSIDVIMQVMKLVNKNNLPRSYRRIPKIVTKLLGSVNEEK